MEETAIVLASWAIISLGLLKGHTSTTVGTKPTPPKAKKKGIVSGVIGKLKSKRKKAPKSQVAQAPAGMPPVPPAPRGVPPQAPAGMPPAPAVPPAPRGVPPQAPAGMPPAPAGTPQQPRIPFA